MLAPAHYEELAQVDDQKAELTHLTEDYSKIFNLDPGHVFLVKALEVTYQSEASDDSCELIGRAVVIAEEAPLETNFFLLFVQPAADGKREPVRLPVDVAGKVTPNNTLVDMPHLKDLPPLKLDLWKFNDIGVIGSMTVAEADGTNGIYNYISSWRGPLHETRNPNALAVAIEVLTEFNMGAVQRKPTAKHID